MKKTVYILLFYLLIPMSGFSQGFDWQYSARLPQEVPQFFVGLTAEAGYQSHFGEFPYLENFKCCEYNSGSGVGANIGIAAEYWKKANMVYGGKVLTSFVPGNFNTLVDGQMLSNNRELITEYEFSSVITYISAEVFIKRRIAETHLFISGNLGFGYLLNKQFEFKEKVFSPANYTFVDGSQVRNLEGTVGELNKLMLLPGIHIGYDLNLGRGMYASPSISLGYSPVDFTETSEWKRVVYSFGITIYRGIL